MSAWLDAANGTGARTLTVNLKDTASSPVSSATFGGSGSDSISGVSGLSLTYQGAQLSASNPLPVGADACGSVQVENVTAGVTYTFVTTIQTGNNSQVQSVSVTAQLGASDSCAPETSSTTSTSTVCNQAAPMSLVEASEVVGRNYGNLSFVALDLDWSNCSDQTLQYGLSVSPVLLTLSDNGTTVAVPVKLEMSVVNASDATLQPDSEGGIELPVTFDASAYPTATVLHISCNVTAINPATGQPLSMLTEVLTS